MSSKTEEAIRSILGKFLSPITARSVWVLSVSRARIDPSAMRTGDDRRLFKELEKGIRLYVGDETKLRKCLGMLEQSCAVEASAPSFGEGRRVVIQIEGENDIVLARGAGRSMCQEMGFTMSSQIKIATAISELARNIVQYARRGEIVLRSLGGARRGIEIFAYDQGPGIESVEEVLSGRYRSMSGMGKGLTGTRNLVDEFDLKSEPGRGTEVTARKYLD
jgi:serine/threonine-protein kinase RsbT